RLLVVATYRPVELVVHGHPLRRLKADLELRRRCQEVALEFLSAREVEAYLRARLETAAPPDDLAAFVHDRTDGHPLFMTHVMDLLMARGWLRRRGRAWSFAVDRRHAARLVPDTLRRMIAQEIASLPDHEQRVLEAASVAGAEPGAAAVAAALEEPATI